VTGSFEVEALSLATREQVFAVLADVPRWHEWAGPAVPASSYAREGADAPGGLGAIRKLGMGPLSSLEEIVAYDPPEHLAYVLLTGQRWHRYQADVHLHALANGGTRIVWTGRFQVPRGLQGPLTAAFRRLVGGFAHRLAARAEATGPGP